MRLALRALAGLALLAACGLRAPAAAPLVKPWTPPGADSITSLVAEAKVRFRQLESDTIGDNTILPFEQVGLAARRLLRRLGRDGTLLAPSIAPSLDSLGADVEVVNDPQLPSIVFVLVRNPYRRTSQSLGYILWYRGADLRMQGTVFPPAIRPRVKSWWTGNAGSPYATAVIYEARGDATRLGFKYLRLSGDGFYWNLLQYEGHGPELGIGGDATFADLNHDGLPEIVAWSTVPVDSAISIEGTVHPTIREVTYTDRGDGFTVEDARLLPGPLATLEVFVEALRAGNREQAARLVADPEYLVLAKAAGWADYKGPGNFVVDSQEEAQRWPTWLGARVRGVSGVRRWVFHFTQQNGHWLIKDWIAESPAPQASRAPRDSTGGHRP